MKTYQATYLRVENRVITIECQANSEDEASEKFDAMVEEAIMGESEHSPINFDEMECVHAEDYVQDIELID